MVSAIRIPIQNVSLSPLLAQGALRAVDAQTVDRERKKKRKRHRDKKRPQERSEQSGVGLVKEIASSILNKDFIFSTMILFFLFFLVRSLCSLRLESHKVSLSEDIVKSRVLWHNP